MKVYCEAVSQNEWADSLTKAIAGEVRRHRLARKMSAQQLADRCGELGMEIPRAVLANLENGRRPIVSVAELLVLAAALDVPPVVLVTPLGHAPGVEILPGRELDTWDAALWISGDVRLPEDAAGTEVEWLDLADEKAIVPLYQKHDLLVGELQACDEDELIERARRPVLKDVVGNVIDIRSEIAAVLQTHRALMAGRGLLLPALPAGLEDIDSALRRPRRGRPGR